VRISPDELSISDANWFDVLYKGRRNKWAKNSKANGSPGSIASTVSHTVHRARRGAIASFFSRSAVDNLSHLITAKVSQLCDGIENFRTEGKVLELGVAFTALTLDVISDYCFGASWGCLDDKEFRPEWKRMMYNLFEPVPVVKQFPVLVQFIDLLPRAALKRIAPDMALFQGAKDVSFPPCAMLCLGELM
jgi:cytochrome P450